MTLHKILHPVVFMVISLMLISGSQAARVVHDVDEGTGRYSLPVAPATQGADGVIIVDAEMHRTVINVDGDMSTAELLDVFWRPLDTLGYSELFRCREKNCGGIAFRQALGVAPFPEMYVNLADYRYLAAISDHAGHKEYVSLLVSRTASTGYVQIVSLGRKLPGTLLQPVPGNPDDALPLVDLIARDGHAALTGLQFSHGSGELVDGEYPALAELALWLIDNPDIEVALVGHTDNEGSLEGNETLSRSRANTVLEYLKREYGVDDRRIAIHGIGYLAPRTSNMTSEGRGINRRVEIVLTGNN